jgi:hypothetical protein
VKLGDPVTMKLAVSGRGNFDRMDAPALVDPTGWRSYPASADFKADDDLGTSGTKTFSMAVIPEAKRSAMPAFEFIYFDPAREKYVTLGSQPEKLEVEGTPLPTPVAVQPKTETKPENPAPEPTAARDILGIRYDTGGGRRSFNPIFARRGFLLAQAVPLAALLGFIFVRLHRTDAEGKRAAVLKRQKAELRAKLRGRDLSDQEFLETAARVIQVDTALETGRPAGSVDASFAQSSRPLDAETAAGVERIFNARAELLYAGISRGGVRFSSEDRQRILATVENFERSHRHA